MDKVKTIMFLIMSTVFIFAITFSRPVAGQSSTATAENAGIYRCGIVNMRLNHHWYWFGLGSTSSPVLNADVEIWDKPDTAFTDMNGEVTFQLILDIYDNTALYYCVISGEVYVKKQTGPYSHKEIGRTTFYHMTQLGTEYDTQYIEITTDYIDSPSENYQIMCVADIRTYGWWADHRAWSDSDGHLGPHEYVKVMNRYEDPWDQVISIDSIAPPAPRIWQDSITVYGGIKTASGAGEPVSDTKVNIKLTTETGEGSVADTLRTNSLGNFTHRSCIINPMGAGELTIFVQDEAKGPEYMMDLDGDTVKIDLHFPSVEMLGLSAQPHSSAPPTGGIVPITVVLTSINDYAGIVDLSISSIPDNTFYSFENNPVSIPHPVYDAVGTLLNVQTTTATPIGLHQIEITAICGVDTVTQTCPLLVTEYVPGATLFVQREHLFQDNFPSDGSTTGNVRADMAADILPSMNPNIRPGDSAIVQVSDTTGLLEPELLSSFGSAVYIHARVQGPRTLTGAQMESGHLTNEVDSLRPANLRFPLVGDHVSDDGATWYQFRMDTVFIDAGLPVANEFCIDFNDTVLVPGDTVLFYYEVKDSFGITTFWSEFTGETNIQGQVLKSPMEFTCLPANALTSGVDILYVNDFHAGQVPPFYDTAFMQILGYIPDRFDVRAPYAAVSNGLGSRVQSVADQLIGQYRTIIWNTGDLETAISDGGPARDGSGADKSDDFQLLFDFMETLPGTGGGVYLSGDDMAEVLAGFAGAGAINYRSNYITYNVTSDDYFTHSGGNAVPLGIGTPGSLFSPENTDTTWVIYGGRNAIKDFDVMEPTGTSTLEATYMGTDTITDGCVIANAYTNLEGNIVGTVLSGYSFHYIRDDAPSGLLDRVRQMRQILQWLGNVVPVPSAVGPEVYTNSLAQNYPNPFNPTTTIKYSINERTHVTLKVYNVAGQLVRTLVDEVQTPQAVKPITWDGRNNAGQSIASGVYFYRLVTKDFTQTKKLVLLK